MIPAAGHRGGLLAHRGGRWRRRRAGLAGHPPSVRVPPLAALAVVCTAVAFVVFFRLIAEIGPARSTVITYVNPAVAVTLGVLILGERLTVAMAGAFALILAGSASRRALAAAGSRPQSRSRFSSRQARPRTRMRRLPRAVNRDAATAALLDSPA